MSFDDSTTLETTTLTDDGFNNTAIIGIITSAAVGGLMALIFLVICISQKCSELSENKRKAKAIEVRPQVITFWRNK